MKIMQTIVLIIFCLFSIGSGLEANFDNALTIPKQNSSAETFVHTIDSLGYFKYAEAQNIEKLKNDHLKSFDVEGSWGGIWDYETNLPLDHRYYFCDGESVFEQGGFTDMLKEMDQTFRKIGFELSIEDHVEEWDNDNEWLNHSITINGNPYVIFKNFKGYGNLFL